MERIERSTLIGEGLQLLDQMEMILREIDERMAGLKQKHTQSPKA